MPLETFVVPITLNADSAVVNGALTFEGFTPSLASMRLYSFRLVQPSSNPLGDAVRVKVVDEQTDSVLINELIAYITDGKLHVVKLPVHGASLEDVSHSLDEFRQISHRLRVEAETPGYAFNRAATAPSAPAVGGFTAVASAITVYPGDWPATIPDGEGTLYAVPVSASGTTVTVGTVFEVVSVSATVYIGASPQPGSA